jgi:FlaG/FlaF family flagellin (archaellin)
LVLRRVDRSGGERAISPVVGGALLVTIVVLLATITDVIVLKIGDEDPPAPSARLELESASVYEFPLVHRGGDEIDADDATGVV